MHVAWEAHNNKSARAQIAAPRIRANLSLRRLIINLKAESTKGAIEKLTKVTHRVNFFFLSCFSSMLHHAKGWIVPPPGAHPLHYSRSSQQQVVAVCIFKELFYIPRGENSAHIFGATAQHTPNEDSYPFCMWIYILARRITGSLLVLLPRAEINVLLRGKFSLIRVNSMFTSAPSSWHFLRRQ